MDCPEHTRHPRPSRRGLFKGLGTQAAKMTMATGSIVKDLDVVEDVGTRHIPDFIIRLRIRSFFRLLKKDSATALTLLCQGTRVESARSARMSGYNSLTI